MQSRLRSDEGGRTVVHCGPMHGAGGDPDLAPCNRSDADGDYITACLDECDDRELSIHPRTFDDTDDEDDPSTKMIGEDCPSGPSWRRRFAPPLSKAEFRQPSVTKKAPWSSRCLPPQNPSQ